MRDSIEHLLRRRAALLPDRPTGYEWVADDPVVGFVSPMLWHLNRKQGETDNQSVAPGGQGYWINAARFTLLRDRLEKILAQLQAAVIPVIVLKGALLAETLFASPGLRAMSDLDLLVRHDDFHRTLNHLAQMGWEPRRSQDDAGLLEMVGRSDVEGDWQIGEWVFHNEDGCTLDLHTHLVPAVWLRQAYRVNMETVWQEAVLLTTHGLNGAFGLSPVHTLAYLCLHLAQHGLQPLRGMLDVDQFVRQCDACPSWSWERFIVCAGEWQMRSAAFHVLHFSQYLFGTPVPEPVPHHLNPGLAARARVAALIRPTDLLQHPPSALGLRYPTLVKAALVDRTTDLARLLLRVAIPDIAWRAQRYGANVSLRHHWRHVWQVVARGD